MAEASLSLGVVLRTNGQLAYSYVWRGSAPRPIRRVGLPLRWILGTMAAAFQLTLHTSAMDRTMG